MQFDYRDELDRIRAIREERIKVWTGSFLTHMSDLEKQFMIMLLMLLNTGWSRPSAEDRFRVFGLVCKRGGSHEARGWPSTSYRTRDGKMPQGKIPSAVTVPIQTILAICFKLLLNNTSSFIPDTLSRRLEQFSSGYWFTTIMHSSLINNRPKRLRQRSRMCGAPAVFEPTPFGEHPGCLRHIDALTTTWGVS